MKNIKIYGVTDAGEVIVNGSIIKDIHYDNLKIYKQEEVNKWDSIFSLLKKDLVASLGNSKHNIN